MMRSTVSFVVLAAAVATVGAARQPADASAIYLFVTDAKGAPLLDLKPSDIVIREDAGQSRIESVSRFGWPLKVTVLVDNGLRNNEALVHFRTALKKFFDGLPPRIPVSLIATAPNPRWLIRESTDRIQIDKGVNLITIDEGLGRFSDALGEFAIRLDKEFERVEAPLPPYLPVLVSIASANQDGSQVLRDANVKMITSLRKHRVWTTMIMVSPGRSQFDPGGLPLIDADEGQNAEIAKIVQEATGGRYVPITGAGTSALSSTIMPDLAQEIALRYLRQMTQHRVVFERPAGATGAMKNFSLSLVNRPGSKVIISTNGSMP